MLTRSIIAFVNDFVLFSEAADPDSRSVQRAATIQAELVHLGYMLNDKAFAALKQAPEEEAVRFYQEVIPNIQEHTGYGECRPLYDGFPQQVMEMSEAELFFNAICHYWSGGEWVPDSYTKSRPHLFEHACLKTLSLGNETRFQKIFQDLVSVGNSLTQRDTEIIAWFAENYPRETLNSLVPERIPFKENLAILASYGIAVQRMTTTDALRLIVYKGCGSTLFTPLFPRLRQFSRKERREILELLETISLNPAEMRLKSPWWQKVGEILHPGEYAKLFPKTWAAFKTVRDKSVRSWQSRIETAKTLEEKLEILKERPGELARRLDSLLRRAIDPEGEQEDKSEFEKRKQKRRSRRAAKSRYINNWKRYSAYNLFAEKLTEEIPLGDFTGSLFIGSKVSTQALLKEEIRNMIMKHRRDLLRSFNAISASARFTRSNIESAQTEENTNRNQPETEPFPISESAQKECAKILNAFEESASGISAKVLYELANHFEKRRKDQLVRNITFPGCRKLVELPLLKGMNSDVINTIQEKVVFVLKKRFSALPALGKCYIDPQLSRVPLPTNMRSVNPAIKPLIRGCRMKLENEAAKTIRFYNHWFDEKGYNIIDLSATLVNKDKITHISWNQHYNVGNYGCHSGDVVCHKGACAEYIDIVIDEAAKDYDYVVVDVRDYMHGHLGKVAPIFGVMEREHPESDKIWIPDSVEHSFRITTMGQNCIAAAFDLKTKEYIWLDVDTDGIPVASLSAGKILEILMNYMEPPKLSVKNLLRWHIEARGGELLPDERKGEAETVFRAEDFTKDYVEILKWMGV